MSELLIVEILRKFGFLCVVVAIDVISGVTLAVKDGGFTWEKLPKFVEKYVPMVIGWLLAEALGVIPEDIYAYANLPIPYSAFTAVGNVGYGVLLAAGFSSTLSNLANIGLLKAWLEKFGFRK